MVDKIQLDIISDIVCPWCIIGYKRLISAILELNLEKKVEIIWHPFEINSDMPKEGENLRAHVARKYGSSREDSDRARLNISQLGSEYGFEFHYFENMKIVNTLDAHILLDVARSIGKQTELKLRFFSAFFSEGKDISNRTVLINEAKAIGISEKQLTNALNNDNLRRHIQKSERDWQRLGVSSVPTMIFNRSISLTGAHPQETYKHILLELINNSNK
ncbi:DsbA family oxidoreductase [Photobacterium damselae]|uniref:DsbA family oxidoreductase n=1 Tax=Photobacterium damselae TaxID=38293 RepID=UPI00370BC461